VWFRRAAEQGNADAMFNLAGLYGEGRGVPQDYAQEAAWLRKAADQSHAEAQYLLGLSYMTGRGVTRDYAEAYFWMDLAASGNTHRPDEVAKDRDDSASHLSSARLLQTQKRVRKWFDEHSAKPTPQ
jgi:hypothetical protein